MTNNKKVTKTELRRQLKYNVIKMLEDKGFTYDDEGSNITFFSDQVKGGNIVASQDYTIWYRPSSDYVSYFYNGYDEDKDADTENMFKHIEDEVNQMIDNFNHTNNLK